MIAVQFMSSIGLVVCRKRVGEAYDLVQVIGQAMIEGATAQDRQLGSGNKTSLLMTAMANAPYVSGRLFQRHAARSRKPLAVWRESIGAGGKECRVCGLIFAQLRDTKKFCSTRCRQKAFRPTQ